MNYEEVRDFYISRGFGGRVGFGTDPAIVVIDMARSWLDETSPLGSRNVAGVMEPILEILSTSRKASLPIFFTTMAFDPNGTEAAGPVGRKLLHSSDQRALERHSGLTDLDPRLERRPDEILIEKQRASAFWGTPFQAYLTARKIDTLIVTGCSTSGCVRSTAESAHNVGLHTIVAREAVGDRSPIAHECNLIDIDMRFADVVSTREILDYIKQRPSRRTFTEELLKEQRSVSA
ncbi:MAG: carbamoylsarcosine amidase [Microvirga sp.]|nr:carbamoylsarcosine amidase [Microvirga sp.]